MSDDLLLRRNDKATEVALNVLNRQVHELIENVRILARQQATLVAEFQQLREQVLRMTISRMSTGPTKLVINPDQSGS
jgi:uncharacterized coiled-coil DUF342 family protein